VGDNFAMAHMVNVDRDIFSEAHKTVLDNFTEEEQRKIHEIAEELREVLAVAKQRLAGTK
jgi:hypothetical protein